MFDQHTLNTLKPFYMCLNDVVAQSIVTYYVGSKPSPSKPFEQLSYTAKRQKGSPCSRKFVCYSLHHHNELVNNAIMTEFLSPRLSAIIILKSLHHFWRAFNPILPKLNPISHMAKLSNISCCLHTSERSSWHRVNASRWRSPLSVYISL